MSMGALAVPKRMRRRAGWSGIPVLHWGRDGRYRP